MNRGYLQNLVGIISAYSTDDRYSDDIHYWGGCLAAQNGFDAQNSIGREREVAFHSFILVQSDVDLVSHSTPPE
jgi:hypothetical protein